jgi:hypothetical protein
MTFFFSSVGGSGTLIRFMRSVNFTLSLRQKGSSWWNFQSVWQKKMLYGEVAKASGGSGTLMRFMRPVNFTLCLEHSGKFTATAFTGACAAHADLCSMCTMDWLLLKEGAVMVVTM